MEIAAVFLWVSFAIASGIIAHSRGRSVFGFFCVSLLFGPIIGLPAAMTAEIDHFQIDKRRLRFGNHKRCTACREVVLTEATICRACGGSDFEKNG